MLRNGFTLVELLIVIAIIGILSTTIFVSLNSITDRAKITKHKHNISVVTKTVEVGKALNHSPEKIASTVSGIKNTTTAEKIIGSFPYLNDISNSSNNCRDLVSGSTYKFIRILDTDKTINTGSHVYSNIANDSNEIFCVDYFDAVSVTLHIERKIWWCGYFRKSRGLYTTGHYITNNRGRINYDCNTQTGRLFKELHPDYN